MVTFELGLEVGIGVYVKREEKGIQRNLIQKKKRQEWMKVWNGFWGKPTVNCVRIELGCREIQKKMIKGLYFLPEIFYFKQTEIELWIYKIK